MLITDSALWPRPRVSVTQTASSAADAARAMAHTTSPSATATDGEDDAAAEAVEQPADADGEAGAEDRRPEVQLRVGHAIEAELGNEGLGDEPQALCPARQGADHGRGRHQEDRPAVVDPGRPDPRGGHRAL